MAETHDFDRDRSGETVALDILDCRRVRVGKLDPNDPDRRLEAMAPRFQPAHMRKRHGEADRAMPAHAEITRIVEENHTGGA